VRSGGEHVFESSHPQASKEMTSNTRATSVAYGRSDGIAADNRQRHQAQPMSPAATIATMHAARWDRAGSPSRTPPVPIAAVPTADPVEESTRRLALRSILVDGSRARDEVVAEKSRAITRYAR
jgi:hypothetical protein